MSFQRTLEFPVWLERDVRASIPGSEAIGHYVQEIEEIEQSDGLWFLGCGLVVLASLFSSLSVNLQKHAHLLTTWEDPRLRTKKRNTKLSGAVWLRSQWICGIMLLITGSICDFVALAFCSQITVGVLGALSMVINLWVTSLYLREPVGKLEYISTSIIITGCLICVISSSQQTKIVYTVSQIMLLYRNINSFIFLVIGVVVIAILRLTVRFTDRSRHPHLHRFCHPASAGLVGSQGVLFGKYTAEMIHSLMVHGTLYRAFSHPINVLETIVVIPSLFVTIFLQLRWLNQGLHHFDALITVPTFQVCWVMGSVSGGVVVFQEMERLGLVHQLLFFFGVVMAIVGVLLMAQRKVPDQPIEFITTESSESEKFAESEKSCENFVD